ncbi:MAG: PhzF family phenazine biosynthesis protein [Reyranellaceae bacterium]
MLKLPLYHIDAFASRLFAGNPAAVVPLDDWLPDPVLQSIAAENNLSETAFFIARGDEYELRWFTPKREVELCGHATLAAGYVIATYLQPGKRRMKFHTHSGVLSVERDGSRFNLDFPSRPPQPVDQGLREMVAEALGQTPTEVLKAEKLMAVLPSSAAVRAARPDLEKVAALEGHGLIVTAPAGAGERPADFVSRYFAPHVGVPEDPVTGSAHCLLTPYWAKRLKKSALHALQVSARGGELFVALKGSRVIISGQAIPYLEGQIHVPAVRSTWQQAAK